MDQYPHDATAYNGMPMMNHTPQMFGDYGSDTPGQYSGNYYAENDGQGGDDNGDPKRRRIARACDMCRKKKIKCDGKMPKCSHCINYKTECIFTQVEKKRQPPKGAKYIEGLENRLGRMESLLKLSGILGDEEGAPDLGQLEKRLADKAILGTQARHRGSSASDIPSKSPPTPHSADQSGTADNESEYTVTNGHNSRRGSESPGNSTKKHEEVEALSDMMCSLVTNNYGETRYIGSSSGFSIFSPKGIQWVNEKTGDDSFQKMMTESSVDDTNHQFSTWKPEIFGDIFARRVFRPLPPLNEALSLLKDYFENFNCMFPLFHEPTFMHLVQRQYSRDPYDGSGWWASLNCVFAIAHRLRVMSNLVPAEEDQKAWGYMKNALGVIAELTMKNTDLLSVQALLGMALFLTGTHNPQPSFLLVAAAVRMAHSIGLHKKGSTFNLSPVEVEQRKRVFWIAYLLDKDMCLRSGRPPTQDDDDMNVELPAEDPGDNIGNIPLSDGKSKINLFRLMCTFSQISGMIYKRLYSTKAAKSSDGELLNAIGELDKALEDWKDSISPDFRPENEIKATHTPLILHVVVLHFSYYNSLTTIHRMSVQHGYWSNRLSNYAIQGLNARPLNPRVFSSAAICVQAARSTIQLLKYIPQGDFPCVWMIIYYPVSALMTLFTNVLQNPQDARTRSDIRLMHQVVSFLSSIAIEEETGGIKRMLEVCVEFERIAKLVVDKSDRETHSRRKRKTTHDDDATADTVEQPKDKKSNSTPIEKLPTPITTPPPPPPKPVVQAPAASMPVMSTFSTEARNQTFSPPTTGFSPVISNIVPSIGPQPGDFPNMFTEFSDLSQFGAGGIGSPGMSNFQQQLSMGGDLWQMPMASEWDGSWGMLPENFGQGQDGTNGGMRHNGA